ncbi:MAG: very short patch repair endonuclease, partial [Dehalococcoidia bacterium]
ALHAAGFRFRLHRKDIPGRPDIVLPRYRRVVLVNGCFWHGHGCALVRPAKANAAYWEGKLLMNKARDARNRALLAHAGFRISEVWQCTLAEDTRALIEQLRAERARS